jgi:hypothetical protein
VYAGQPRYSLRARNNEFRLEQIKQGIDEAHARGKKFFVTSNLSAHNDKIRTYLRDIEPVIDQVTDMLDCHESQFYEWLPWVGFFGDQKVPTGPKERKQFLRDANLARIAPLADRYRDLVIKTYGPERGRKIKYIEAFEGCEYGSPLDDAAKKRLFPFVPQ